MTYIEKEWKEQSRGKGIWLSLGMVALVSLFILLQSRTLPNDEGFEVFLLSLYEMNVYLLPILSLFLASFAIMQEREQKTMTILLTKKESYMSFYMKKSMAVQTVLMAVFVGWYFIFALVMKLLLSFHVVSFLCFLLAIITLMLIFNQVGLFLGSICHSRMQLVGANIFIWFFFVFFIDLAFLYFLPSVTNENISVFSVLFFLHPMHAIHFFMETSLGLFSTEHMSRLMQKLVWMSPTKFLLVDILIWITLVFGLGIWLRVRSDR